MDTLEQARAEINAVDAQLAALFERRMAAVLSVAQYKQAHGLPIIAAAPEASAVGASGSSRVRDKRKAVHLWDCAFIMISF